MVVEERERERKERKKERKRKKKEEGRKKCWMKESRIFSEEVKNNRNEIM
jgi:hypothetical protein